jgi:hypothetical protein
MPALDQIRPKTFLTAEDWAPLDRKWCAVCRLGGKTIGTYGSTREDAVANLKAKIAKLGGEDNG